MGAFATAVQSYLRQELTSQCPALGWETEYRIDGTPVDVAGKNEHTLALVELEWRRADPADNTAKLFRHLESGSIDHQQVRIFQVFTRYYDLASGGHSSKRKNAEFVGYVATDVSDRFEYDAIDLAVDPPKRGGEWPEGWHTEVDAVVERICARMRT